MTFVFSGNLPQCCVLIELLYCGLTKIILLLRFVYAAFRVIFVGGKPGNFPLTGSDLPSHWQGKDVEGM